jgi:hypothetical protein
VWAQVPLPVAAVGIDPGAAGITQLPSWFWVPGGAGPVSTTVSVGAYTVTATASPVAYRWDFGDGTSAMSDSPGRPGEPSAVHTYGEQGTYTVSVAVEYSGRYIFAGPEGTGSTVLGDYWQAAVTRPYVVQEVVSVLVPGGDG